MQQGVMEDSSQSTSQGHQMACCFSICRLPLRIRNLLCVHVEEVYTVYVCVVYACARLSACDISERLSQ